MSWTECWPGSGTWQSVSLPATVVQLANGLTVIAHRDANAPGVGLYVAYRAGSRDEPFGKAGLAHLCEHLLFAGTRQFPANHFVHLERLGATSINAISHEDYTASFELVPRKHLDTALAIEAARMRSLSFGPTEFRRQCDVIRNELIQREGSPFGSVNRIIAENAFFTDHPYAHPANGTLDGLKNISPIDAEDWCSRYFCPSNAILVVAGNIEPDNAIASVRRYFESITAGSPNIRPTRSDSKSQINNRVLVSGSARRLYLVWNVPPFASPEHPHLALFVELLAGGPRSCLSKSLRKVASSVGGELFSRGLGSQVVLRVDPRASIRASQLEQALRAELTRLTETVPTSPQFREAKIRHLLSHIRMVERLCGRGSKTELLGTAHVYTGDCSWYEKAFSHIADSTWVALQKCATTWLGVPALTLAFEDSTKRRSAFGISPAGRAVVLSSPALHLLRAGEAFRGISRVVNIERPGSILCEIRLVMRAGWADNPPGKSGCAALTLALLTGNQQFARLSHNLARAGATIETRLGPDASVFAISCSAIRAEESLKLLAAFFHDVQIEGRGFAPAIRRCARALAVESAHPADLARRLLPALIFPSGSPCAQPFTGSGTDDSLRRISIEDASRFLRIALSDLTVIVVGPRLKNTTLSKRDVTYGLKSLPSKRWTSPHDETAVNVIVANEPYGAQAGIFAALPLPAFDPDNYPALLVWNAISGGYFSSRLNMGLRERMGWTYGAHSTITQCRRGGIWLVEVVVERENAVSTIRDLRQELCPTPFRRPVDSEEHAAAVDFLVEGQPLQRETLQQLAKLAEERVALCLPDNYHDELAARLRKLLPLEVNAASDGILSDRKPAWLVIGDAATLAPAINAEGLGRVRVIDLPSVHC